jgi:hypothetical protein
LGAVFAPKKLFSGDAREQATNAVAADLTIWLFQIRIYPQTLSANFSQKWW